MMLVVCLFMLDIEFCTFKTGSESKGQEKKCSLFAETALAPLHCLAWTVLSAAWAAGQSSPLSLVSFFS